MLKIGISVILGNKFPFKEMKMHTDGGRATDAPHSCVLCQQRLFSFSPPPLLYSGIMIIINSLNFMCARPPAQFPYTNSVLS